MELVITIQASKKYNYPLRMRSEWRTDVVNYDSSGVEQRNQVWSKPRRSWALPYSVLTLTQRNELFELAQRAKGRTSTFLFEDPYDHECLISDCSITAIAAQVDFQLDKDYYPGETETWTENKIKIQPSTIYQPYIEVDGAAQVEGGGDDYTLDDTTGIVTFGGAHGAGAVITANYYFYYKVRFVSDAYVERTMSSDRINLGTIPIIEVA